MTLVLTKRANWRRVSAGLYGNRLRSWDTLADLRASGWDGLVTVRTLLGGGRKRRIECQVS